MEKPKLSKDKVQKFYENPFLKLYGLEYVEGMPYINASRREQEELVALKSDADFKNMMADAVSCVVIIDGPEPQLLLSYEFRYPTGQYLLGVPAGLMDEADKHTENPLFTTAIRELKEETNLEITAEDKLDIVNPLLFSSPGMTDESNAIVSVIVSPDNHLNLNQEGAEATECFDGFELLTEQDARKILKQGKDKNGIFYSVYTWIALMWFVSGMWRE